MPQKLDLPNPRITHVTGANFHQYITQLEADLARDDAIALLREALEDRLEASPQTTTLASLNEDERLFLALDRFAGAACQVSVAMFFDCSSDAIVREADAGLARLGLHELRAVFHAARKDFNDRPPGEPADAWLDRTFEAFQARFVDLGDELWDRLDDFTEAAGLLRPFEK